MVKVRHGKKGTRSGRKAHKKHSRNTRRQRGGWQRMNPANIDDMSMNSPSKLSLAQGGEYDSIHRGQHGGATMGTLQGAPVGSTGVLDSSLRDIARVSTIDQSIAGIQGMSDQSGGRRRRSKRSKRSKRSQRGGSAMHPADYHSPGHLLSPGMESKALMGMNPEWKLAENPNSFAPRLN
jgi:hypothetical protein